MRSHSQVTSSNYSSKAMLYEYNHAALFAVCYLKKITRSLQTKPNRLIPARVNYLYIFLRT